MKPNILLPLVMRSILPSLLSLLISLSALAQNTLVDARRAVINGLELRVDTAEIGKRLLYDNRPLPLSVAHDFVLKGLFVQGENVIVLVAALSGGTVCPAVHRFITFEYTRTLISEGLGNCLIEFNKVYQQEQQIIVEFAATETKSAAAFIYNKGQISMRTTGVEATPRDSSSTSPHESPIASEKTPPTPTATSESALASSTTLPQTTESVTEWLFANRRVTIQAPSLRLVLSCDTNALALHVEHTEPLESTGRDLLPGTFKIDDREFHMEFRREPESSRWQADRTRHLNWNSPFVDLLISGKTLSINFLGKIQALTMKGSARAMRALQSACAS